DLVGFEVEMANQRNRARATSAFKVSANVTYDSTESTFHGYEHHSRAANVLALYQDGVAVLVLEAGATGMIVLDHTPFYAEGGGQVGDMGLIVSEAGQFKVLDTQKIKAQVFGQMGFVETGVLRVGDAVTASVDLDSRQATSRNHSATHLLHSALRKILGSHVAQKGSLVNPERARFDFTHSEPLSAETINAIETHVNSAILDNAAIQAHTTTYGQAIAQGAIALFGEKYGDDVRVLSMGEHSTELCGGVHANRTGDIGLFKIISEGGVAAGTRRIEAVTGTNALAWVQQQDTILKNSATFLQAQPSELFDKLTKLQAELKSTQKEMAILKSQMAFSQLDGLLGAGLRVIQGVKAFVSVVEGLDVATLREMSDKAMDNLCANHSEVVILLASVVDGKVNLIARVSKGLTKQVKAGDLVNWVAEQVGGKGGGRPDMAQAGGTKPEYLEEAIRSTESWLTEKLQSQSM
ncbi:MAG: alanine--tRNA ligase, partial [Neisseriaceae bacterium]|nr:alanine--tRNA ligase [Neisseriaceae bacterium]